MTLLLLGCGGAPTTETVTTDPPALTVSVDHGGFLDPKLPGSPSLAVTVGTADHDAACVATLVAENAAGQSRRLTLVPAGDAQAATWDGKDETGAPFDPGAVRFVATTDCGDGTSNAAEGWGRVVRLGVASVDFVGGDDRGNVEVAFHKRDVVTVEPSVIDAATPEYRAGQDGESALGDLDEDDGTPRAAVPPWTDPDIPPWTSDADRAVSRYNVPAAYVAGSRLRIDAILGTTAVSMARDGAVDALGPAPIPAVRAVPAGWEAVGSVVGVGEIQSFDGPVLDATLGLGTVGIDWTFQARDDAGTWWELPGSVRTEHQVYRLAGQSELVDGTAEGFADGTPWLGTIADTMNVLDGVDPDAASVLDALRYYLYDNDWLVYDPGDSSYSEFDGPYIYWESITSDLSSWLDRRDGTHLYCHSVSCLYSVLAGSVGVSAPQQVLSRYPEAFATNLTRAAGSDAWQRWTFNSHSVVSPDGGATTWDASIDLDGDGDPYNEPVTPFAPMGVPTADYMALLTADPISIVNAGPCFVR